MPEDATTTSSVSFPGIPDGVVHAALSVPMDFVLIFVVFILLSWQAFRGGSAKLSSLATALLAALFTYPLLPQTFLAGEPFLNIATTAILQLVIFALLVIVFYFVMRSFMTEDEVGGGMVQGFLAGGATTVLLLAVWQQLEYTAAVWEFGSLIQAIFAPMYAFWWIIGSLILLAVARRGAKFY